VDDLSAEVIVGEVRGHRTEEEEFSCRRSAGLKNQRKWKVESGLWRCVRECGRLNRGAPLLKCPMTRFGGEGALSVWQFDRGK
jgi:hypothetical protein